MTTTDTNLTNPPVYNILTQQEYNTATINENEFYFITDGVINSSDVITALGYTPASNSAFTGADGTNAGTAGIVPAPTATDNTKFLKGDGTWAAVSGTSTDVQINGTSITNQGVANIVTNTAYNSSSNKIATMSDLPTYNFIGESFYSTNGNATSITRDCNSLTANGHYYYTANGPSGLGEQSTDGAVFVQGYSDIWVTQIAQDYRTGNIFVRSRNSGTWTAWKSIEYATNKVTSISSSSTDTQYPSAKCVYDALQNAGSAITISYEV